MARRTIGPIVSASSSVGSTRLTVSPCFSLSDVSRARSANSEWWKLASANQRSTRAGTARDSSAARSAAARLSARCASCSNVWRPMGSRVLTTMTVGSRPLGDRLGQRPEQRRAGLAGRRRRAHHDEVRALRLAQDRRPHVGGLAQDRLRACGDVLAGERGERVLRLGAHRLGDAGRHDVHDGHRRVVALGERVGEPERQLRVGTAADGDQDPPDVARAALLDHRDVARRLADDLVDGRRDHGRVRVPVGSATCRPSRRSSGRLPARPPPRRSPPPRGARCAPAGGSRSPRARSRGPSAAAGAPAWRASHPRTAACPPAPRRCRARSARPSAAPSARRRSGPAPPP